nr:transposase [Hymenolepis microstoma]
MVPTFKVVSGEFVVEDGHSGGREKVVEDAELETRDSYAEDHEDCPVVILLRRHLGRMNIHGSKVTRLLMLCVWWEDQLGVIYYELLKPSETLTDVAPSADFHLTHLAQWHTAWLSSTSARVKK